jgi:hypothetical protein
MFKFATVVQQSMTRLTEDASEEKIMANKNCHENYEQYTL